MVGQYDQMSVQGKIRADEAALLANEKQRALGLERRLRSKIEEALAAGQGMFRGVQRDATDLGKSMGEIMSRLVEGALPALYPKIDIGMYRLSGSEAVDLLKATDLSALPQVLYAGEHGMGLVVQEGARLVLDTGAPTAREVLGYLNAEQQYGNKVTGKSLEDRFTGFEYGWDVEVVQVVLAALLRAGAITVTYQGNRYRNAADPLSRAPFERIQAFRSSSFAPRESISIRVLASASENYEEMTGERVHVEEGAIAEAARGWAQREREGVLPVSALARAHNLPIADLLDEYRQTLEGLLGAASDDCVRALAGAEGTSLQEQQEEVRRIRHALSDGGMGVVQRARRAVSDMLPMLQSRDALDGLIEKADLLENILGSQTSTHPSLRSMRFHTQLRTRTATCIWPDTRSGTQHSPPPSMRSRGDRSGSICRGVSRRAAAQRRSWTRSWLRSNPMSAWIASAR